MARIRANGIELEYDTLGNPDNPAILLIMGFAFQMTRWPAALRHGLADAGFHVIWFDNRDIGLSAEMGGFATYTLSDLASDAAGLLDALGIERAHVVGMSMGGMIAQLMALDHPRKVHKLVAMMTSSGAPDLPAPTQEALAALTAVPMSRTPEAIGDIAVKAQHAIGSAPHLRNSAESIRQNAIEDFHRSDRPFGVIRQFTAIQAQPRWHERLGAISQPTLVLHGAHDPLVRPAAGEDIARRIPGARFKAFPGWGHDLADTMSETLAGEITAFLKG
ncbi:MAG: alpha/beta hydrolase [Alphaproteobacteria bacterium HGW-Alphaproteobacteria-18]|nr:MAG: alpha/beta hydrolase [Alphaproteobacteria bacterium HGW-Alphaproteobacteria-18]